MKANFVMETKEVEADFYLDNTINQGSGISDHSKLTNRDLANQHPIKSITGLQDILDALADIGAGGTVDLSAYLSKEEASATYSTKDNVSSSILEHNSSTQSHSDIRGAIKANTDSLALKANKRDVYTKEQVDAKISSVYRFCGSVASYNNLPQSDQVIGDTYNVEDTGANYAWTGTIWDKLSETIDLTNYATTENVNSSIAEHNLSSQSHNDIRNSLAGKANLASQENTKIGNIAVVDKDGQYEVSDTKLSDLNADIGTLNTQVSENTTKLASCVTSTTVTNITQITQAEYDALTNKDSTTLYIIIG